MNSLAVSLGVDRVGTLERFTDEYFQFSFHQDWLDDPKRPLLGQLFEDRFPHAICSEGTLPCWFLHLLPQGPLADLLAQSAGIPSDDPFELLSTLGTDLPGNVLVRPVSDEMYRAQTGEVTRHREQSLRLAFSLAGVQWKMSARRKGRGLVVPAQGETGDWIAKFHDPHYGALPRIELATAMWARASGIEIPETQIVKASSFEDLPSALPIGDGDVFLIRRFDRSEGGHQRVHTEDFAQILDRPPGVDQFRGDYEELGAVLRVLCNEDCRRFVEQIVFCIVCGNGDAHLKNWSVIYPDRRRAQLSPAYDLLPTVLFHAKEELALNLGGTKCFTEMTAGRFEPMARALQWDHSKLWKLVLETQERVIAVWEEQASSFDLQLSERTQIEQHIKSIQFGAL